VPFHHGVPRRRQLVATADRRAWLEALELPEPARTQIRRLPIAHLTPHTLRRTFASILAATNVPPRRAMYLLGHTDPKLTLSVYQQVLDVGAGSIEVLKSVLGRSLSEAATS
jgi:integrase